MVDWIWGQIKHFDFQTCLDAFGGTGVVAYQLKEQGKTVTYNDVLTFNHHIGQALIENSDTTLSSADVSFILELHPHITYPDFVERIFQDIYFTDEENRWIDRVITNIRELENPYKQSLAFFALAQACIVKRPYNLFHRKNLYIRFAEVERSFGNKASWDKPFPEWFQIFVDEANQAVFSNGLVNKALNQDVLTLPNNYDLVYIDPPYMSGKGVATNYYDFYHFLEGLAQYDVWANRIDYRSKHRRLKHKPNRWTDKRAIHQAFDDLFAHFANSILVVSYRSDGIPTQDELVTLMKKYKSNVQLEYFGNYQYVLSTNRQSQEILLIGTD